MSEFLNLLTERSEISDSIDKQKDENAIITILYLYTLQNEVCET